MAVEGTGETVAGEGEKVQGGVREGTAECSKEEESVNNGSFLRD